MKEPLRFKDLVDLENLKAMVLANHRASGLPIGIIDASSGEIYAGAGWQRICTEFHRKKDVSRQRCVESDTRITANLMKGAHFAYKCKNGLWDIGIPIFCVDQHIATIFLGQFFYDDEKPDRTWFASQADRFGFDKNAYLAALDDVPVFSREKVDNILTYNKALAEFISNIASKTYLLKSQGDRRYRNLVTHSPGILYRYNEQKGYFFVSDRAKDHLGYSAEYLMENPFLWCESVHPEDKIVVKSAIEGACKGQAFIITYRVQDDEKRWHWFRDRSIGIFDTDDGVSIEGLAIDITKEIESREALKQNELKLLQSNQDLERFAYMAAHELQAPLRSLAGFLQLLQSRYDGKLDEKGRHYLSRSINAGNRMQALITDFLALSRIGYQGGTFHRMDMNRLVRRTLEELEPMITNKRASIKVGHLPSCFCDARQVHVVFQNLIVNALNYDKSDQPVVEIGHAEEDGAFRFFVKDHGIGIPTRFHEKIFRVFQRLHTEREYPGTGLGLYMCKRIIERHEGAIWVESEPEKGATFYFTIPKTG